MNKVKILLLFILMILLSGCNIEYLLTIDESLNITENIHFEYDDLTFDGLDSPITSEEYNSLVDNIKQNALKYNYNIINNTVGNDINITLKKTTSFISFKDPIYLEGKFENFNTNCSDKVCSITASVSTNTLIETDGIKKYIIGISVPYKVIKHNAKDVDLQSNTFYWYYSAIDERSNIELIFNKSGKNVIEENKAKTETKRVLWIIIGLSILATVSFIGTKIYKSSKVRL